MSGLIRLIPERWGDQCRCDVMPVLDKLLRSRDEVDDFIVMDNMRIAPAPKPISLESRSAKLTENVMIIVIIVIIVIHVLRWIRL